jgi:PPP family 3-phenylpropionic acid transporter
MAALNRWFVAGQQARAQALYGSIAYGAGGLGGALLAGALWESAGAGITFSAASALALIGLILIWRGVPGDSAGAAVR